MRGWVYGETFPGGVQLQAVFLYSQDIKTQTLKGIEPTEAEREGAANRRIAELEAAVDELVRVRKNGTSATVTRLPQEGKAS